MSPRHRTVLLWASAFGAVGPLAYILLVTQLGRLWDGYDPIRQSQSELGGIVSPFGTIMNVGGFMGLGVSVLVAAWVFHRMLGPGIAARLCVALLMIAGAGLIAVGFMPCDPGCVDVTSTGRWHSLLSAPPAIALPLAGMLFAGAHPSGFGRRWAMGSGLIGVLALLSGPIVGLQLLDGFDGIVQRAGMWLSILWLAAVCGRMWLLIRNSPVRGDPDGRVGGGSSLVGRA